MIVGLLLIPVSRVRILATIALLVRIEVTSSRPLGTFSRLWISLFAWWQAGAPQVSARQTAGLSLAAFVLLAVGAVADSN